MVSGLFEEVRRAYCDNHLKPHTVNLSLGVFGKTEKLPKEPILEIASMCGHNMISFGLIQKLVTDIEEGWTMPELAAKKIAAGCRCGVFNWERAARVLARLAHYSEEPL